MSRERLQAWPSPQLQYAEGGEARLASLGLAGVALWPGAGEPSWEAWPEGNRTLILDRLRLSHRDQDWLISVKGVGALQPMFGAVQAEPGERQLYAETWFGEAPWGAQGDEGVSTALAITAEAKGEALYGMPICPLLGAARLPEAIVAARQPATYRGWHGGYWQELRLVPSRVRLAEQSDLTLAFHPQAALAALGVADPAQDGGEALDAFIDELLRSGLCALTLAVRSAREERGALSALVMDHVWLDKDTVVAPDGALCFADLEGLERIGLRGPLELAALARKQLYDHSYELLYAVDRLLGLALAARGRRASPRGLRQELALRVELAMQGDPLVEVRAHGGALDLLLRPGLGPMPAIRLPLLSE